MISELIKNLKKPVEKLIDKIPDVNEKRQLEAEINEKIIELEQFMESEISKRHAADMVSDSWLSKNVRPLTLICSFILLSFVVVMGVYGKDVSQIIVTVGGVFGTIISFYFGSRGWEKVAKIKSNV